MKTLFSALMVLSLAIAGCEGEADKPKFATSTLTGKVSIGQVSQSRITAYDFSNCSKGQQLADTGIQSGDAYSFSIENRQAQTPVLLEVSNITYTEEIGGARVTSPDGKLYGVVVIGNPGEYRATISYWTSLAYARTAHLCKTSNEAVAHIESSINNFTAALSFNPVTVDPLSTNIPTLLIEDVTRMRYGIANAALSSITATMDTRTNGGSRHESFNSMTLVKTALDDLSLEGMLNGVGSTGQLNMADVTLDVHFYRNKIADQMDEVLFQIKEKPGFGSEFIRGVSATYNASTMDIFAGIDPVNLNVADTTPPQVVDPLQRVSCTITNIPQNQLPPGVIVGSKTTLILDYFIKDDESSFEIVGEFVCSQNLPCCNGSPDATCLGMTDTATVETVNPVSPGSSTQVRIRFEFPESTTRFEFGGGLGFNAKFVNRLGLETIESAMAGVGALANMQCTR